MSENFAIWTLYQVALGIKAMHNNHILHRDIKPDNVLVHVDGQIKLCDMGFSCFLSQQEKYRVTRKGTLSFMSPEIIEGINYSKEVDIWAYGCLAFELLTGEPPFTSTCEDDLEAVLNEPIPELNSKWSPKLRDFVAKCLEKDPTNRWTID